jgi:trimethylamine---corrinoid protein Co-methyltransferase
VSRDLPRRRPMREGRGGRVPGAIRQLPWGQPRLSYRPVEILSGDEIEAIHQASLTILETVGMKVLDGEARRVLRGAGASVDEPRFVVTFDRAMIEEKLRLAPPNFVLHASNPERALEIGGGVTAFTSVGGPAYVTDLDRGRRAGSYAEVCEYLKLIQSLNIVHQEGGGPFEALDLPQESRHLDLYYAQATLLDKNWQPWGLGAERTLDALEMAAILHRVRREDLGKRAVFACIINTNSPLQLDIPMAEGLMEMARHGQAVVVTPFTLAGAMSPVTLAGALAQQNAEALAAIALVQCVRPGAPVVYGAFTTNVDMRSGAPAFGTPEYTQAAQISGQLARRHKLPFRSSNVTTANAVDAQAAYESAMALWGALMGHAHLVVHAAGWLGGGLTASFEKLIVDAEMLQMMAAYLTPPVVDEASLGVATIAEIGHGGHFFGAAHTLARYEHAFYAPLLSDWDNYDNWVLRGSPEAATRANRIWKQMLLEYEQPPLDPAVEEALRDYVERRKREIGQR